MYNSIALIEATICGMGDTLVTLRQWKNPETEDRASIFLLRQVGKSGIHAIALIYHMIDGEPLATEHVIRINDDGGSIWPRRHAEVIRRECNTERYRWVDLPLAHPAHLEQLHSSVRSCSCETATYDLWIDDQTRRVYAVETPVTVEPEPVEVPEASAEQVPCDKVRCTRIAHRLVGDVISRRVEGVGDGKVMRFRYCADCCHPIPVG